MIQIKRTFWEEINYLLGWRYIINTKTKEVHDLKNKKASCRLDLMSSKNKKYVGRQEMFRLVKEQDYNGCRWCMKIYDRG